MVYRQKKGNKPKTDLVILTKIGSYEYNKIIMQNLEIKTAVYVKERRNDKVARISHKKPDENASKHKISPTDYTISICIQISLTKKAERSIVR